MTDAIDITPLSHFEGDLRKFVSLLSYAGDGGRVSPAMRQQWDGDHQLLGLLDEARRRSIRGDGEPTIGELPAVLLQGCVDRVESLRYGKWRLAGDDSQPIIERLDAHFRPMAEAHVEHRRLEVARLEQATT